VDADTRVRRYAKPVVFLLCLLPVAWLGAGIYALQSGDMSAASARALGANPVEKIQDTLGIWGLRFLLLTLAITPSLSPGLPNNPAVEQDELRVWLDVSPPPLRQGRPK